MNYSNYKKTQHFAEFLGIHYNLTTLVYFLNYLTIH
nr:MAG TPA_asm: hypothetical protein [Caudoviricetes sp.]